MMWTLGHLGRPRGIQEGSKIDDAEHVDPLAVSS
jgi:hypothetical protein